MKKILLTGITGQVGQELQKTLAPIAEVIGCDRTVMDLAQPAMIRQVISDLKPDLIINSGAYTAVDKAESEKELAFAINGHAPGIIAVEASKIGSLLIHISTDYVFNGESNFAYTESDQTNPLSVYGESKLAGEEEIKKTDAAYVILRTAWVYNSTGKNFVKTMLRLGGDKEELRVVSDQIGSPTWAKDIANAIAAMIPHLQDLSNSEIYHFTNSGVASWYDFAIAIFEEAKNLGFPLKVERVVPITTSEYPTPAKRPAMSVLSTRKISQLLGTYPPHWRSSLRKMLQELYSL